MADQLTPEQYARVYELMLSGDKAEQQKGQAYAKAMTPDQQKGFFDFQKTQTKGRGEYGRMDSPDADILGSLVGGKVMGAGVRAVAPALEPMVSKVPGLVKSGVRVMENHPIASGAVIGGVQGGLTKGPSGILPGAMNGAELGGLAALGGAGKLARRVGGSTAEEVAAATKPKAGIRVPVKPPAVKPPSMVDPTTPLDPAALSKVQGQRSAAGLPRLKVQDVPMGGVKPQGAMSNEEFQRLRERVMNPNPSATDVLNPATQAQIEKMAAQARPTYQKMKDAGMFWGDRTTGAPDDSVVRELLKRALAGGQQ